MCLKRASTFKSALALVSKKEAPHSLAACMPSSYETSLEGYNYPPCRYLFAPRSVLLPTTCNCAFGEAIFLLAAASFIHSKEPLSSAPSISTTPPKATKRTDHTVDEDNGIRVVNVELAADIISKASANLAICYLKPCPSVARLNIPGGKLDPGCRLVEMQIKRVQLLSYPVCVAESSSQKSRTDGRLAN